ncbi:MAG: hypothetical protein L0Z54_00545 [Thermoplasmata archaeon]|nr:hypothetical protein [Thermoplasmata archaeon]
MRALATVILASVLAVLLVGPASAAEGTFDDEFELDEWEYADYRIDLDDRQKIDIRVSKTVPEETNDTTENIDVYLLTEDEFANYEDNDTFTAIWQKQKLSGIDGFYLHDTNATTLYLVIDNTNNNREDGDEALPGNNGTITVTLHYEISDLPYIPPPPDDTDEDPGEANLAMFIILASIVLIVFAVVAVALRRRAPPTNGSEAPPADQEDEEDYFGRMRVG